MAMPSTRYDDFRHAGISTEAALTRSSAISFGRMQMMRFSLRAERITQSGFNLVM
jgi:hypothetical protein